MVSKFTHAHCIGIGGIHVSAVAKLLKARGVVVTGSDTVASDETSTLEGRGIPVAIGHDAVNVPSDADVVIYSHAVPPTNPEFAVAQECGIEMFDTHRFLAEMYSDAEQLVVTGTHGKSTTASMLGAALVGAGEDPTIVVGTKVKGFPDENLRIGKNDLIVIEGDEYRKHILNYTPKVLVINNIELDHTDVFPDLVSYIAMFKEAIGRVREYGIVIYNADDANCRELIADTQEIIQARNLSIIPVGSDQGLVRFTVSKIKGGMWSGELRAVESHPVQFKLQLLGAMNIRNAAMTITAAMAWKPELDESKLVGALAIFPGCWRRMERIGSLNGAITYSDYGHHPTEVSATVKAVRESYPDHRIVLCFQPHHRNRTRYLFDDFVKSFSQADVVLLSEIYDVPGREAAEDAHVSSAQLAEAILGYNTETGIVQTVEFVGDLNQTELRLREVVQADDIVVIMGAGTIDGMARRMVA